ncbi:MAG: sigma-70 family RNA polymerase sigma factor [Acidobacteria bacterium]|nr:sigma-70 family RNA polymerase sigma factor [Acidobacteriota bacterium]
MQVEVSALLEQVRAGDREALNRLMPLVYDQLRSMAARFMNSASGGETLRTTALVHEAYLRLVGGQGSFESRSHFFGVAAKAMRAVLIDHARGRSRQKRGGEFQRVDFDEGLMISTQDHGRILEIDDSLRRLEAMDPRKAQIVELLYFGGLTHEETAAVVGVSETTIQRDLKLARAWLHRDLGVAQ